jgi:EAL domain-containing protein (putative c-di-GMP-specific phosphodiesterase class I)
VEARKPNSPPVLPAVETVSAESLGKELRLALPPVRLHSVSLCNTEGDVLWLSEGVLGPDEHNVVMDALQILEQGTGKPYHETGLDDGRFGMFLAIRDPRHKLLGMVMLLTELKALPDGISEQLSSSKIKNCIDKVALFLGGGAAASPPLAIADDNATVYANFDDILSLKLLEDDDRTRRMVAPATPPPARNAEEMAEDLTLSVQELVKLRSSGRTRRYEVFARSRSQSNRNQVPGIFLGAASQGKQGAILDDLVVQRVLAWLNNHQHIWDGDPVSFSINLSLGTLKDFGFLDEVAAAIKTADIPAGSIGFEISEQDCVTHKPQAQRFITACEKIGCFIVLDDFTFDSAAWALLSSKAVRMVKIDPKLTAVAMKEKLPQAIVIAILQACKVLGIHCIAKKVETHATLDWLEAVGCDFAQGFALEKPLSLDSLATPPPTPPRKREGIGKFRG